VLLCSSVASADQFVLFDVTFTYTWDDAVNASPSQSHYYVNDDNVLNTERPENWLSPLDYRGGSVHIRVQVLDKPPGDQAGYWSLCYVANQGSYGCTNTGEYTAEGLYEKDVDMTSWWQNDQLDWAFGVKQMDLVYKKSSAGSDHIHQFPELQDLLTPTTLRITMVQVSLGDTYDESSLGLDFGAGTGDGGAGGVAGTTPGNGGVAGTMQSPGGASGAGGTSPTQGGAGAAASGAGGGTNGEPLAGGAGMPTVAGSASPGSATTAPGAHASQASSCATTAKGSGRWGSQALLALGLSALVLARRRKRCRA
jgi:hypothetical protein